MRDSAACGESRGTKGRTDAHYQPNSCTQLVGDHIDCVIYSYDNKFLVFKQVPMFKCYYRHFRAPKFKKLEEKCQENLRIQFFLLPRQSSLYWGLTDSRGKMHWLPWRESIISSKKNTSWRTNVGVYGLISFFLQKKLQTQPQRSKSSHKLSWWRRRSWNEQHVHVSVQPQLKFKMNENTTFLC